FGTPQDLPLVAAPARTAVFGDFEGDRRADLALYRPATGSWWIAPSSRGYASPLMVRWGTDGDVPVPGDYLGIRTMQAAVFRQGTWFLPGRTINFGQPGDTPVPADFDGDGRT